METTAFLDAAAGVPMRASAVEAMLPFLTERFGNPSGSHRLARDARTALDEAREVVAAHLGGGPHDVVFTSGGTEADNLAVRGVVEARGGVPVCPATEHHAVLHPVEALGGRVVAVDRMGRVDLDALVAALDPDVAVVSVMLVNNETGLIQDLAAVAEVVRAHAPNALLHTDAVQACTWLDVATATAPVDLVSVSAHKFGGPKGIGALVVKGGAVLGAQILGGGQEQERRSGTQNVAGAVAMAAALSEAAAERDDVCRRARAMRDRLAHGLAGAVGGTRTTTDPAHRSPGMLHLVIDGIETEALLVLLEREGIVASAAASCASGAMDPSHVLAAMGYPRHEASGSLRLSIDGHTTDAEIEHVLAVLPGAIEQLRAPVRV